MDGFTPEFVLQVIIAVGSAAGVYGGVRADLRSMTRSLDDERRLREEHQKSDDVTHHDIRNDIATLTNRITIIESRRG